MTRPPVRVSQTWSAVPPAKRRVVRVVAVGNYHAVIENTVTGRRSVVQVGYVRAKFRLDSESSQTAEKGE